jgi:hypothetical protein
MRIHSFAIAGIALVASTALIGCSSDNKTPSNNSGVPVVVDSTIATTSGAGTVVGDTTLP